MKVGFLAGANCHALAIARHFSSLGIDCFGIGRGPVKPAPLFQAPDGYRYYQASIGSQNGTVFKALDLEKPDILINLCAQGEGAASFGPEAWMFYRTNCAYLAQLCETLKKRKYIQRFIHIGTSELYGSTETPATEDAPIRASSPYAISKAAFDQQTIELHHRRATASPDSAQGGDFSGVRAEVESARRGAGEKIILGHRGLGKGTPDRNRKRDCRGVLQRGSHQSHFDS